MFGIKSQPLDDGDVPLFMSFYSCHRGGAKWFPLLQLWRDKRRELSCTYQLTGEKLKRKTSGNGCAEKRKSCRRGGGCSQNDNE
jgi:hypothetical protein